MDGKLLGMVEGRLVDVYVEDIVCGVYYVVCVILKLEVYIWGKGVNG